MKAILISLLLLVTSTAGAHDPFYWTWTTRNGLLLQIADRNAVIQRQGSILNSQARTIESQKAQIEKLEKQLATLKKLVPQPRKRQQP
jgi:hypothetical protein